MGSGLRMGQIITLLCSFLGWNESSFVDRRGSGFDHFRQHPWGTDRGMSSSWRIISDVAYSSTRTTCTSDGVNIAWLKEKKKKLKIKH